MREKCHFLFPLSIISLKYLCDKRFNRLRFGVLVFQKCIQDLNGPAHQKEERGRKKFPGKKEMVQ